VFDTLLQELGLWSEVRVRTLLLVYRSQMALIPI